MTDAAQLLGGPKVPAVRGPGKDQPPVSGEERADFGDLLAAVEQLAELQAEGVIELDPQGFPIPVAGADLLGQGEKLPNLGALIARAQAVDPEILDGQAGAQTFIPKALGQPGRASNFKPLDLSRAADASAVQTRPSTLPQEQAALAPYLRGDAVQAVEVLQTAAAGNGARGELAAKLPDGQPPKIESTIAPTPRLDAALQQHGSQETSNPVVRQLAQNIQVLVRGDMERMRFDLYPEELGRVSIQMQKTAGATKIMIVTETPQAFEALQRGASGLQQSLSQAGFDADEMTFEQHSQRGERETAEERRERDDRRPFDETDEDRRVAVIRPAEPEDRGLFL